MADLATRYREWRSACDAERLRAWLADGAPDLVEVDARFEDVTSGDAVDELRREAAEATLADAAESRRRWQHLVESAALDAHARRFGRELHAREHAQHRPALGDEPDAAARAAALEVRDRAAAELDELREEQFARCGDARAGFGHADGRARARALHPQVDFEAWDRAADGLLERTEPAWLELLHRAARRARLRAPARADLPWLLRGRALDRLFGGAEALLAATFDRIGVAPDVQTGAGRDGAARCFEPGRVVVAAHAGVGLAATRSLFAAAGPAWAAHFRAGSLPVERHFEIDPALRRGWALLCRDVLRDPDWIAEGPAHLRADELAEQLRLQDLFELRGVAARVGFESALADLPAGSDPHAQAARRAESLERATTLPHPTAGYLLGADPELGSVHELRARALAAQLREALRSRFGRRFWHERGACELLKELWHTGGTYRAEPLAADLGLGELDVAPLVDAAVG